jgi:phosphoglycolate phosphatase
MYDLYLFDFDGTLVDSMPSILHASRRTFEEKGLPVPDDGALRAALADGRGVEFFFAILVPGLGLDEAEGWVALWRELYEAESRPYTRPYPGALETLARLREAGAATAVVSNKGEPALRLAMAEYGFEPLMDAAAGDVAGLPKKPFAEMYHQRIAPMLGDAPAPDTARILMVGDSEADLRFGRAIGARCAFAAYGYGQAEECLALAPELVLDSVTDLQRLVR